MENAYKIRGHESFCIREGWLSKGMEEVKKNPKVFSVMQGADALGVGVNMAKSIRYWLKATGLVVEKPGKGAMLSSFGELVYRYDPYMEEDFTLWCIHINLAMNKNLATSWFLFFEKCKLEEFKREDLELFLHEALLKYTGKEELNLRSVKEDSNALLQMYARVRIMQHDPEDKMICPLTKLGILRKTGEFYRRLQPEFGYDFEPVFLYYLQSKWEEEAAISMERLYEGDGGVRNFLGLGKSAFQDCLQKMEKEGYLDINRTAGLDMIYKKCKWSKEDVVREYYRETKEE